MYNDNKYFSYSKNVFLLYKKMYNDNIYFLIHEINVVIIQDNV